MSLGPGVITQLRPAGARATSVNHRERRERVRYLAPVALGLVILLAWLWATRPGGLPPQYLPAPGQVATTLAQQITHGVIVRLTAVTIGEALAGCAIGAVIGIPLGYAIARWRVIAAAVEPYLAMSQAVPAVALAPLLTIWVGYGYAPVIALASIIVLFPIVLSTAHGIRSVDEELIEAARLDGAGAANLLIHIEIPLALPAILTGLRNGFTLSVTGAVVGEMVTGGRGLGSLVSVAAAAFDTAALFAALIVLSALAAAVHAVIKVIESMAARRLS